MDPDFSANPQELYSWKAPLRAYKKTPVGVLRFYIALSLLLSLLVYFFGDIILVIPIWSVMFLFYVFTITPPPIVEHKITTFGLVVAGTSTYRWDILSHYYFTERFDYEVLVVVTKPPYDHFTYLVLENSESKMRVSSILAKHIVYQENPERLFSDKLIGWLNGLMPSADERDETVEKVEEVKTEVPVSAPQDVLSRDEAGSL